MSHKNIVPREETMSQNSASKTILLVEDEVLLAMGTKMTLEKNGYKGTHALHGDAAIQAVEAGGIDLILMDIDLGRNKMDGTEAAEKILEKHTVPIIFHTGHSEKAMVDKVKGITRYGYVLKNAGEFVLLEAIQMAFELFNANRQIIEKEERYQYMFEYSRSCVAVLKAVDEGNDFVFIDYNQTAEETDKIRKDEVIGNRVTEVFPGVEEFGLLDVFRTVWRTGETKAHTDAFYSDERISGWRENLVYKMPSGEIVSVYRDVTEEKENEEKLQVASLELKYLYEMSHLVETEGITLSAILQGTVNLLPKCIGEAGTMNVRLTLHGREYVTANFQDKVRAEVVPLFVYGEKAGELEIFCTRKNRQCVKEKYPEEFHMFLETLPKLIGRTIERFQSMEELQERKESYRNILESIGDAVISTDIQGNITRTNHIAREMIGCSEGDIMNKSLYDIFTLHNSEDGKPIPNPVETVLHTDRILTLSNHTKLISKYGKELHIADSVAPVHDARGETRGAVLVFRDETEKYEQERKLRESEERYRRLFENMAEGFIRTDAEGIITLVNQAAVELCGYDSIDDLAGRRMTDLYVDPSARNGLIKKLEEEKQFRNHDFLKTEKRKYPVDAL